MKKRIRNLNFKKSQRFILLTLLLPLLLQCGGSSSPGSSEDTYPVAFTKKVIVFGLPVIATTAVSDAVLLHCASVLAEYLDSDEDGVPNSQAVIDSMKAYHSVMLVTASQAEFDSLDFTGASESIHFVDMKADQIRLNNDPEHDGFDAALEEVLHFATQLGYSRYFSSALGEVAGSQIADAMDVARGGRFGIHTDPYPVGAWYTYRSSTCEYSCQITEYTYWGLTSILGAQDYTDRGTHISNEWDLNTSLLVQAGDPTLYALLTNPAYHLPTALPNGTYSGSTLSVQSIR